MGEKSHTVYYNTYLLSINRATYLSKQMSGYGM